MELLSMPVGVLDGEDPRGFAWCILHADSTARKLRSP